MNEITIKSQEELDALESFETLTKVFVDTQDIIIKQNVENMEIVLINNSSAEIYGNSQLVLRDNSRAELLDNSEVELYDNSSATLYDNSSATLWDNAFAILFDNSSAILSDNSKAVLRDSSIAKLCAESSATLIENSNAKLSYLSSARLLDNSCAELFENSVVWSISSGKIIGHENSVIFTNKNNVKVYDNATIKPLKTPTVSFDEWISRGWVVADGIPRILVSQKTIGDISVYETDKGYVVKKGDKFSHGETAEKAIEDLRYKIADRDSSKFSAWKLDDVKSVDELIEAYRVITGACEMGVKEFCGCTPMAEKMTVLDAIKITENHYGSD